MNIYFPGSRDHQMSEGRLADLKQAFKSNKPHPQRKELLKQIWAHDDATEAHASASVHAEKHGDTDLSHANKKASLKHKEARDSKIKTLRDHGDFHVADGWNSWNRHQDLSFLDNM